MNSNKKLGRKAALAAALVVLLSAAVALAQVAWEFTPGEAGGSFWSQAYKGGYVGEAAGEVEVVGTGGEAPEAPATPSSPYDGLLDDSPARFTP